jgi:hypothetical protein
VNTDPIVHNIGGNLWGHLEDLQPGDSYSATFNDAGIYPYACSYHPGMTGAIVVGDGDGAGNGEAVTVGSPEPAVPSPEVQVRTVGAAPEDDGTWIGWAAGAAIGLAIGLGAGLALRRRARGGEGGAG